MGGKRSISPATRQRVLASIGLLGYHPRAGARALGGRRADVIALVLPLRSGMHLPVLMQLVTAVVTTARGYHDVLLMTADEDPAGPRRVAHVVGLLPELGRRVPADVSVVAIGRTSWPRRSARRCPRSASRPPSWAGRR